MLLRSVSIVMHAGTLNGCAIFSENYVLAETPERISDGKAMITEGKRLLDRSQDLRRQGKQLIEEGNNFERQGEALIERGEKSIESAKTLDKAEKLRLEGEQIRRESTPQ